MSIWDIIFGQLLPAVQSIYRIYLLLSRLLGWQM